jgi:hypothetical protein
VTDKRRKERGRNRETNRQMIIRDTDLGFIRFLSRSLKNDNPGQQIHASEKEVY